MKLPAVRESIRMVAPTSSWGSPKRAIGVFCMIFSIRAGSRILRFCSAGKKPGERALTRTPIGASPRAAVWVRWVTAAVAAEWASAPGRGGSGCVGVVGHKATRLPGAAGTVGGRLAAQTGLVIAAVPANGPRGTVVVHTVHDSKAVQELGEDESYVLEVSSTGATLTAPTDLGALHGLQTFLQLVSVSPDGFTAPAVSLKDTPRSPWRRLRMDSGRHFNYC